MAKRKKGKKKQADAPANAGPKADPRLNPAFAELGKALKQVAQEAPPPEPAPQAKRREREADPAEEEAAFLRAMGDVSPLDGRDRATEARRQPNRPKVDHDLDEDLEVLAQLADLVSGAGEMDLSFTSQYVIGSAPGISPELMDRLKRGLFPIQGHLDLHGLDRAAALEEVDAFLTQAQVQGLRHVLVVHGKGANSPDGVPVIKRALAQALTHKRMGKKVMAFCTALPRDGGTGALYVLLRRWRGPHAPRW